MSEIDTYVDALRRIAAACERPFGKDARTARRIALDALNQWGRARCVASKAWREERA